MNGKNIKPNTITESQPDFVHLQVQIKDIQMEINIDILKETIHTLEKGSLIDSTSLKNREKAVTIDVLKNKCPLPDLQTQLELLKGSYYYRETAMKKTDKYSYLCSRIRLFFNENKQRYGSRRIYGLLKREGFTVSEKVVRRIMREERLTVIPKRLRKYNSYQGEISPSVPKKIERDFHADKPNLKWLTDITEFALPVGKVYLAVLMDCFPVGQIVPQ